MRGLDGVIERHLPETRQTPGEFFGNGADLAVELTVVRVDNQEVLTIHGIDPVIGRGTQTQPLTGDLVTGQFGRDRNNIWAIPNGLVFFAESQVVGDLRDSMGK
ncbi:hypothetical protein Thiowin_03543 [Thiorhodovibrio winogradskyi]|uniref:Uncharacterized protein n=1 Tax=Thiorhodovibrio winogradskyi TaxID=77007 RepID=A0ABZ0SBR4_9GAMM|nr:hypothetical protein [Thiorhodovibrio winogradskyi]